MRSPKALAKQLLAAAGVALLLGVGLCATALGPALGLFVLVAIVPLLLVLGLVVGIAQRIAGSRSHRRGR